MGLRGTVSKAERSRARHRRSGVAAAVVATGLLVISAAPGASLAASRGQGSTLARGLAFYRGKTITLIAPATPGGTSDLNARLVAPYLASYLHATVNVFDNGVGATFPGQDEAASAAPDGLTLGMVNTGGDVTAQLTDLPSLNFNPMREIFLGKGGDSPEIWVATPASPFRQFADLLSSPSPPVMLAVTSGTSTTALEVVNGIFGIRPRLLAAYGSTPALLQGFQRGDGEVANFVFNSISTSIIGGQARPLLLSATLSSDFPVSHYLSGIPTVATFALRHPPRTKAQRLALRAVEDFFALSGSVYFAPTRTPADRVAALEAALRYALGPASRTQAVAEDIVPGYSSGAVAKADYVQLLASGKYMVAYLTSG